MQAITISATTTEASLLGGQVSVDGVEYTEGLLEYYISRYCIQAVGGGPLVDRRDHAANEIFGNVSIVRAAVPWGRSGGSGHLIPGDDLRMILV